MHVSRVAALLLRAVRRSRRPLAMTLVASIVAGICVVAGLSSTAMAAEQPKSTPTGTDVSGGGDTTNVTSTAGSSTSTPAPSASSSSSSSSSSGDSGSTTPTKPKPKPKPHVTVTSKAPVTASKPSVRPMLAGDLVLDNSTTSTFTHGSRPVAGDTVTTTWKVENTTGAPITGVSITPTRGTGGTCTDPVPAGGTGTCVSTTTLTQADVDAGSFTFTAKATGVPSGNSNQATATVTVPSLPGLQFGQRIFRVTDKDHNGQTSKGDIVQFVFTVKNTGNDTVHGLIIIDAKAASAHVAITCSATTLAPKQTTTCRSGGYTILGSQAKAGFLTNTAQARVTTSLGKHFLSAVSKVSIGVLKPPPPVRPHLALRMYVAKIGTSGSATHVAAGDTISYGFVISNTGNTRISGLSISDQKLENAKIKIHCNASSLSAGAATRCISDPMTLNAHVVEQQDLTNFASVHGRASNGAQVSAFDKITIGLSGNIHALIGSSGIKALPRTGGVDTTPITLGFWMVLIGLGLVVAGRRPGRPADAVVSTERRSWISSRAVR